MAEENDKPAKPAAKKKPVKRPVPVKKQAEGEPAKKTGEAPAKKPVRPVPVKKQAEKTKPDTPEKKGE